MRATARIAAIVLATAALGPFTPISALAAGTCEDDTTPPVVSAIAITPGEVVVGKIKQSVTARVSATDDCTIRGSSMSLTYSRVGDVSGGSVFFYGFDLVEGSAQSGVWEATEVLSDYQPGGAYEASEIGVYDDSFNTTKMLYPASTRLQVRGSVEFEVSAPAPARIAAGSATQLSGYLELPSRDAAGALELQALSRTGTWTRVGPVARAGLTTYSRYSIAVRPTATTRYRLAYLGDAISAPATSTVVTVAVAPAITAKAAATTVRLGRTAVVSGAVRPALPGQSVVLQRQAGSRWVSLATARIDAKGAYRAVARMGVRGAVVMRVVKGADRDRLAGASSLVRVQVR
jgi:hypothetical protein